MKNRRINFSGDDLKIELGCGNNKKDGFIGLDCGEYGQEILWDLRDGLPFPDNSCIELYCDQVLEHIQLNEDFIFIMNECLRVLKTGGKFEIRVPHYSSHTMKKDPTHYRNFSQETFSYLEPSNKWEYGFNKGWQVKKAEQTKNKEHLEFILIKI